MTIQRIIELLAFERKCVESADECDRNCAECNLVQNTDELLEMYDSVITLLKAQESVKPHVEFNPAGQPMWCCGKCGTTLFFKFPRQTDDEDQRSEHRFCHYCGRAVKWE